MYGSGVPSATVPGCVRSAAGNPFISAMKGPGTLAVFPSLITWKNSRNSSSNVAVLSEALGGERNALTATQGGPAVGAGFPPPVPRMYCAHVGLAGFVGVVL